MRKFKVLKPIKSFRNHAKQGFLNVLAGQHLCTEFLFYPCEGEDKIPFEVILKLPKFVLGYKACWDLSSKKRV